MQSIILYIKIEIHKEQAMVNAARGNTVEAVCNRIIQDLKNGNLDYEERLVAHTLASIYRVSRTPVREALLRLEKEGIVVGTANAGFEPRIPTLEELCELYELRSLLEGYAVEKLTRQGVSPELLAELQRLAKERHIWHAKQDIERTAQVDLAFHQLICESCNSPLMQKILHNHLRLSVIFKANPKFKSLFEDQPRSCEGEHEAIIEAMKNGKAKAARRAMMRHIENAKKCIEKALRRRQNKKAAQNKECNS
jgi:DNA-binding GntR family transcriptional regulator